MAQVALSKTLHLENSKYIQIADRMLQEHAVLRYQNEKMWYDLHPGVYQIPGVMEAIERRKA